MTDLTGRKVIITGGTSGMGEALVKVFPTLGANAVFWGRNTEAGNRLAKETGAAFVQTEVSDKAKVDEAMKKICRYPGRGGCLYPRGRDCSGWPGRRYN